MEIFESHKEKAELYIYPQAGHSFVLYKVGRYDIKGKQYLATGAKYYAVDIGLRYFLLGTKQTDIKERTYCSEWG